MAIFDPKSLKAEEFINHEEILETLKYAEENKNNAELIDSLLEKAKPKKTDMGVHCEGLTHREASRYFWRASFPTRFRRCTSWRRR